MAFLMRQHNAKNTLNKVQPEIFFPTILYGFDIETMKKSCVYRVHDIRCYLFQLIFLQFDLIRVLYSMENI